MKQQEFAESLVEEFLSARVYAVVGVSTNRDKYGYRVYQDLKEGGYTVYPVNPHYEDIFGERCYPDLSSLPEKPEVVEFVCPPPVTEQTLYEMKALGIERAWMQPGAESPQAIRFCEDQGIKAIHGLCVMVERRMKRGGKPAED
ncbi:MAG: CoA-binding protein [Actinobacteria bacterium]|nr:CoA-binding protein [Actinomycetota bacterium]